MRNVFIWISDLTTLALVLFLAGIMISIWMSHSHTANSANQRSLSHFQKFLSSIYGRLTSLENLCLITLCLNLAANFGRTGSVLLLTPAIVLMFYSRYLSYTRQQPIHKQVMKWDADYIPGKWEYLRDYYFYYHRIRTMLILFSLALVSIKIIWIR